MGVCEYEVWVWAYVKMKYGCMENVVWAHVKYGCMGECGIGVCM